MTNDSPAEGGELSKDEVVLLLFGLDADSGIDSTTVLVKEAFLLEKEMLPDLGLEAQSFNFFPWNQGPYSKELAETVNELADEGYLSITEEEDRRRFKLTEKGKEAAEQLVDEKLDAGVKRVLKTRRKGWDQLGYTGLLRRVYQMYPEFTSRSEIKEDILDD